jgi:hypothetical protein
MIIISLAVLALIALISSELRITLVGVIVALAIWFYLFSSLTVEVSDQDPDPVASLDEVNPTAQGISDPIPRHPGKRDRFDLCNVRKRNALSQ